MSHGITGKFRWEGTCAPSRVTLRLDWVAQGLAQANPEQLQLWIIAACCALALSTTRPRWLWSTLFLTMLAHTTGFLGVRAEPYSPSGEAGTKEMEL